MKIKQAKYLLTAVRADQYPQEILPAVSFCGRSNVGKRSGAHQLAARQNAHHKLFCGGIGAC